MIALRKTYPQLRGEKIIWHHDEQHPRLICYDRPGETETIRVYLNDTEEDIPIFAQPLLAHKYANGLLKAKGILICEL